MAGADRRPVVLCVDDEASIRSALRRVFLDEPWEVHLAPGGEEGLEVMRTHEVDLVLSDFRMPGMDGVAFLKEAKRLQPECMRIVFSGYADINTIVSALNEGQIYRFIPKPWNDEELLHNVRKALEHQRLHRENRRLAQELQALNASLERKVQERTRELSRLNRTLRFAQLMLDLLPMPVIGVDRRGVVVYSNAKARDLLDRPDEPLLGHPAPAMFEPELSGALRRAEEAGDVVHHLMPMVIDGHPVGAVLLVTDEDSFRLRPAVPMPAVGWAVPPQ